MAQWMFLLPFCVFGFLVRQSDAQLGCPPVSSCTLSCSSGYGQDANGCELCQCAIPFECPADTSITETTQRIGAMESQIGYPSANYPTNLHCHLDIDATGYGPGAAILITFEAFALYNDGQCDDRFNIYYDGSGTPAAGPMCGDLSGTPELPSDFTSDPNRGQKLRLQFDTNEISTGYGFRLVWKIVPLPYWRPWDLSSCNQCGGCGMRTREKVDVLSGEVVDSDTTHCPPKRCVRGRHRKREGFRTKRGSFALRSTRCCYGWKPNGAVRRKYRKPKKCYRVQGWTDPL